MSQNTNANPSGQPATDPQNKPITHKNISSIKLTSLESEKLKELVESVENLEKASKEATEGGGTAIEDEKLGIERRRAKAYRQYLVTKYGGEESDYVVPKEKEKPSGEVTKPETVESGESGPELAGARLAAKLVAEGTETDTNTNASKNQ